MDIGSRESALLLRRAARATLAYLQSSDGWERQALAEGQFHTGDDPIRADQDAHKVFERSAREQDLLVGNSLFAVVGEESILQLPTSYAPGARVIVVDPLDGSAQWSIMATAFCVAAYCLVANQAGKLEMESAIVANPQHCFTWRAGRDGFDFGSIQVDGEQDANTLSVVDENQFSVPSLAFTGFKTKDRVATISIMKQFKDWNVVTIGGNPVTPYVLVGGLTAAITLRPQATWDAIGLLLAAKTDAVIGALDGTLLDADTFNDLFSRVVIEGNVRRVPALVVAKSEKRYREIIELLAPFVTDDLVISPPIPPISPS